MDLERAQPGVNHRGGDRLLDLVSQGGGELAHHADPVYMREIGFELAQSLLRVVGALALGDVGDRAYEDQTLRVFGGPTMRRDAKKFDGPVGHQQAMVDSE